MLAFYTVASAVLILVGNAFFPIFGHSYSWWLVPVLLIGLIVAWILLHGIVLCLWVLTIRLDRPVKKESSLFRQFIARTVDLLFSLARICVEVSGIEKIPADSRFLLVCNHRTELDPAFIINALPNAQLGFIGKKEVYTGMRFIARIMHRLQGLPIDRENTRAAVTTVLSAAELLKNDRVSVALFPEGYTNRTAEILLPFRNGSFKIATKSEVPIVVCTLCDTKKIFKNMFRRKTVIYFDVLDVLDSHHPTAEIGAQADKLMRENLQKRFAELS